MYTHWCLLASVAEFANYGLCAAAVMHQSWHTTHTYKTKANERPGALEDQINDD